MGSTFQSVVYAHACPRLDPTLLFISLGHVQEGVWVFVLLASTKAHAEDLVTAVTRPKTRLGASRHGGSCAFVAQTVGEERDRDRAKSAFRFGQQKEMDGTSKGR